jgi:excisionase family DNA binding protein
MGHDESPGVEPRLVDRQAAAAALGIGLTKLRELIRRGELRQVTIDGRCLVPVAELDRYVAELVAREQ